ncbi:MAG: rhomboid family intramembrane serine protease, partial [Erysipelotrichaceae bacterium]|nr:rhomboid family intramembrane serine protease [Erysipelotrichaceae bacterium]
MVIFWQGGYFRIPALRRSIFSNIYMNILISFLPNVSLLAHLGGFVAGLFLAFMLDKDTDKSLKINFAVCAVLAIVAMGYMGYKHFYLDKIYLGTDMEVAKILDKLGLDSLSRNLIDKVTAYYGRY